MHNILIMPECIESCFKYVSTRSSVSCNDPVWQTIPCVDNPVSKAIFTYVCCEEKFVRIKVVYYYTKIFKQVTYFSCFDIFSVNKFVCFYTVFFTSKCVWSGRSGGPYSGTRTCYGS